jgi:hypothetical protein
MHLEDGAGVGAQGTAVVGEGDAVRRPDLVQARAGGDEEVGDAEAVADLDQFAAGEHQFAALPEHDGDQGERGGAVVDDDRRLGRRYRGQQGADRGLTPRAAPAGAEVELDVGGAAGGDDGLDGGRRERGAAEVGVHQDAGRVEDRPQAARRGRERGQDGVDGVRRRDLTVPDALLHPLDCVLHQAAAEALAGRGQLRIGEEGVGARHLAAGIAHRCAA